MRPAFWLFGAVLLAGACASDGDPPVPQPQEDAAEEAPEQDAEFAFTAYTCPAPTLVPQDSRDVCGARILTQVFSGLVETDPDTGEPTLVVASSIETDDAVVWTITLEEGWTFHDGEPVTARSFIDAWHFAADPANEMRNADFFAEIDGFEDLRAGDASSMRGLEVIDDHTIEVTLSEPFAPFLSKLTDVAFYPLPSIAFEDIEAFGRKPIGNGRYRLVSYDPDREAALHRNEDWRGDDPGHATEITFLVYAGDAALENAYLDVRAGALDVLDNVPPSALDEVDERFGDRVVRRPTSSFTFLGLPLYDAVYGADADLRRALSLAIDRDRIIQEMFDGALEPATSLIPPVLDAHREGACDYCSFDPQRARELFGNVSDIEPPLVLHFNAGGGHEQWVRAVAAEWQEHLGIDEVEFQSMEFGPYIDFLGEEQATGPFRLAWVLSYLSPEYALAELFRSTGGANYFGYASSAFDAALDAANRAVPGEASVAYQQAEDVVLEDVVVIPLWYGVSTSVHTDRVADVIVDAGAIVRVDRVRPAG